MTGRPFLADHIDASVKRLAKKKFILDPILGSKYSKASSISGSIQKRHGYLIEQCALRYLSQFSSTDFEVWSEPIFNVSAVADNMVNGAADPFTLMGSNAPYGVGPRHLQVDLLTYDRTNGLIRAYEIKRGNGPHDSGKRRSITRDLVCLQILLKGYGETRGFTINRAEAFIIFYYGKCSVTGPHVLTKGDLDAHFGRPIVAAIEEANSYLQAEIQALLAST